MQRPYCTLPIAVLSFACASAHVPAPRDPVAAGEPSSGAPRRSLYDVGSATLGLRCAGTGTPVVVFESGLGADSQTWSDVQPAVAKFTRACSYDREGHGSSSPALFPRDQHTMATQLHALLTTAREPGPFVLVGHSMGAAIVRWFLDDHPAEVAGLVLVDPTTEEWPERVLPTIPREALPAFWGNVRAWEGMDEQRCIKGYEGLARQSLTLGDRPLVILTAEYLTEDRALREQMHSKVLRLSANRAHAVVADSTHAVPQDAPASVVAAIRATLQSIRTSSPVANHLPPSLPTIARH